MSKPVSSVLAASVGAICVLFASSLLAQVPQPVQVGDIETVTATVVSIDVGKRLVELRNGDERRTVQVPAEVQNLPQLKVGDEVVVQYYEGLGAKLRKKGESKTVGLIDVAKQTERAAPGSKPGGVVANTVTTTVVIEGVDRPGNSVTFTGPSGMTRTVDVTDPNARQFIGTLQKGDEVELTYTEALAVTVEPKTRKK